VEDPDVCSETRLGGSEIVSHNQESEDPGNCQGLIELGTQIYPSDWASIQSVMHKFLRSKQHNSTIPQFPNLTALGISKRRSQKRQELHLAGGPTEIPWCLFGLFHHGARRCAFFNLVRKGKKWPS
jgi:hypothetical protein